MMCTLIITPYETIHWYLLLKLHALEGVMFVRCHTSTHVNQMTFCLGELRIVRRSPCCCGSEVQEGVVVLFVSSYRAPAIVSLSA